MSKVGQWANVKRRAVDLRTIYPLLNVVETQTIPMGLNSYAEYVMTTSPTYATTTGAHLNM